MNKSDDHSGRFFVQTVNVNGSHPDTDCPFSQPVSSVSPSRQPSHARACQPTQPAAGILEAVKLERTAITRQQIVKHSPAPDWKKIRAERTAAAKKQTEGFESTEIFKLSVEAKLQELHLVDQWWTNFQRCGREKIWVVCAGCERTTERFYNCNTRWCPRCNWRATERRRRLLDKITAGMTNVKHVVLTQANFQELTHRKIQQSRQALLKLRRRLITTKVWGGCASLEFTNEKAGWHMHWHLLLHTKFLCANCLAFEWGQLVNQEYAIVKVKEVTPGSYLGEVCKYAVKGSELARWTGHQIHQFIEAQRKIRMFSVFGTFAKVAQFARAAIEIEKVEKEPCVCGCTRVFTAPSEAMAHRMFNKEFGI